MQFSYQQKIKIVIAIFCIYFFITFIYCLPYKSFNNKLGKIQLIMLPQKWQFFKDANAYNDRLYYVFYDKVTLQHIATFEVLQALRESKKNNIFFNQKQIVLDNIFFYNMYYLPNKIKFYEDEIKKNIPTINDSLCKKMSWQKVDADTNYLPLATLKQYASFLAVEKNIPINTSCKIITTHKYFNSFEKRNLEKNNKEVIFFETNYFSIQ